MPLYYESKLDGSLEEAEQYLAFNPKTLLFEFLASNGWIITNSNRSTPIDVRLEKDGEQISLLVHVSKIHNQEEGRNPLEKRIQVGTSSSSALFNYPVARAPYGLVLGLYKREVYEDTIICAWPTNSIPSSGSTDSLRVKIGTISNALTHGIAVWLNSDNKIICAFRPEHLHTYIINRVNIHNGAVDVMELIGAENQTESLIEEASESGDFDFNDIASNPSLSKMTKEGFQQQQDALGAIGLNGEEKLNLYFLALQEEGLISDYEWTSNIFPFYPYDFKFTRNGSERFIDAKTTKGGFNRKLFVSLNELKMMNYCANYDLYRLYDGREENTKLKIAENVNDLATGVLNSLKILPNQIEPKNFSVVPDFFNFAETEIELKDFTQIKEANKKGYS